MKLAFEVTETEVLTINLITFIFPFKFQVDWLQNLNKLYYIINNYFNRPFRMADAFLIRFSAMSFWQYVSMLIGRLLAIVSAHIIVKTTQSKPLVCCGIPFPRSKSFQSAVSSRAFFALASSTSHWKIFHFIINAVQVVLNRCRHSLLVNK